MDPRTNSTKEPDTSTEKPLFKDDLKFLIVPIVVIVVVMLLSILVYLMVKRRRMNVLKHHLLHLYDLDSNEEDQWDHLNSYENPHYGSSDYTTVF
ncbi:uncharacterized protein LOC126265843 [Aethina tumida]|uniref:uncharacterized protein LOC126265843 n=1 Tax=Aethina tumida TaxID=116153 RepID=UPI00214766F5|nr:uncharacterized protein LOC126265843 [Aethina tumida]